MPQGITEDLYLVYGIQALVIIGTFTFGILLVPSLTSSIFSDRNVESILLDRLRRKWAKDDSLLRGAAPIGEPVKPLDGGSKHRIPSIASHRILGARNRLDWSV